VSEPSHDRTVTERFSLHCDGPRVLKDLTGPQDLYVEPLKPGMVLDTERLSAAEVVNAINPKLHEFNLI